MAQDAEGNGKRRNWRQTLLILGGTIAYMVPLFWLWSATDFPDSFGVTIEAHGKAGLFEEWWYSYLLLRRPDILDLATFAFMWLPIAGLIGWLIYKQLRRKPISLRIFAEPEEQGSTTPDKAQERG